MDPIDVHEDELDSFMSEFGSRSRIKRDSKSSVATSKTKSAANLNDVIIGSSYGGSNRELKGSGNTLWRSQEFRKISSISSQQPFENNNILCINKDKDIEEGEEGGADGECDYLNKDEEQGGGGGDQGTIKEEEEEDDELQEKTSRHRFTGLGLALLSCLAFSLGSLIIKYLKDYHPFSKSAWRFQGIVLPALPMMIYSRCVKKQPIFDTVWPPHKNQNWKNIMYLMTRATVGLATILLQFYALQYIALADQMVIGASQPVFVSIVAYFMLGEPCGIVPVGIGLLTICGVCVVAKPPILTGEKSFDTDTLIGSGLALGSVLASVLSIVFMRRMKNIHFTLITFTFGVWGSLVSGILAVIFGVFQLPNRGDIPLAIAVACLVFISQTSTTISLKYEQAGPVSLTRSSNIIFAFIWEYLFLGTIPGFLSLIGAAIIMVGVVLTGVKKWVFTMPDNRPLRQRLSCILR